MKFEHKPSQKRFDHVQQKSERVVALMFAVAKTSYTGHMWQGEMSSPRQIFDAVKVAYSTNKHGPSERCFSI